MSSPITSSAFPSIHFLQPLLESPSPTGTWRLNPNPLKKYNFPHILGSHSCSAPSSTVPVLGSAQNTGSLPALLGFSACKLFPQLGYLLLSWKYRPVLQIIACFRAQLLTKPLSKLFPSFVFSFSGNWGPQGSLPLSQCSTAEDVNCLQELVQSSARTHSTCMERQQQGK